jgi:hypothetical protein
MVMRACGAGSVVAYNYVDDGFISGSDGWVEIGLNGSHWPGSHHVLFEGNQAFNMEGDSTFGSSIYMVGFRNYLTGFRAPFTDYLNGTLINDAIQPGNGQVRAAGTHIYHYWYSFIGNVLGVPGGMAGWTYDSFNTTPNQYPPDPAVWMLGWMDVTPNGYDPQVTATAIRDGNYDYLRNNVTWAAGSHALPASLYLTNMPAFFTGYDVALGQSHWITAALRPAGQSALRRRDAFRPTLIYSSGDRAHIGHEHGSYPGCLGGRQIMRQPLDTHSHPGPQTYREDRVLHRPPLYLRSSDFCHVSLPASNPIAFFIPWSGD